MRRPLQIDKDELFIEFMRGLDGKYDPPGRQTIWKILDIAEEMTRQRLKLAMQHVKSEIGSPFFSLQIDIWTTANMKDSYVSLNASYVERKIGLGGKVHYVKQSCLLKFGAFEVCSHTAVYIEQWLKDALQEWGFSYDDVVIMVPDGGANVKKACKLAGLQWHVCYAHDLQRCILYALGLAGKECLNPEMKQVILRAKGMASAVRHSPKMQMSLEKVRKQRNEKRLSITQEVRTRWSSTYAMAKSENILQPDLTSTMQSSTVNESASELLSQASRNAQVRAVLAEEDTEDEDDTESTVPDANPPREKLLTETEFANLRNVEGFASPTAQVTRMLEGEKYVTADRGYPALKMLLLQYKYGKVIVPTIITAADMLKDRKFAAYDVDGLPQMMRTGKKVMVRKMEEKFFNADPCDNDLKAMYLNPTMRVLLMQLLGCERLVARAKQLVIADTQVQASGMPPCMLLMVVCVCECAAEEDASKILSFGGVPSF